MLFDLKLVPFFEELLPRMLPKIIGPKKPILILQYYDDLVI